MDTLAQELNSVLEGTAAMQLFSPLGRRMFFPRGIVAQSAQATEQAKRINASAGVSRENGQVLFLQDIFDHVSGPFTPNDIFDYAPGGGDMRLRKLWLEQIRAKNPALADIPLSLPLVTAGLTHGISMTAALFTSPGDTLVIPDLYWDNYDLVFSTVHQANVVTFPMFDQMGKFNVGAMVQAVKAGGKTVRILLNFPNNPTGYTPSEQEMEEIASSLASVADAGQVLLVICDDAYFGLFHEPGVCRHSLFSYLANAHENILAVKADAATKEDLVWGFRVGFLTYGCKGFTAQMYDALVQKTLGMIRSTVSSCDRPGQSLLLDAMVNGMRYAADKQHAHEEMARRFQLVKQAIAEHGPSKALVPYPFNSGYFMSFATASDAEQLRTKLLQRGIGTISIQGRVLRVAYCSVQPEDIPLLVDTIYETAEELWT